MEFLLKKRGDKGVPHYYLCYDMTEWNNGCRVANGPGGGPKPGHDTTLRMQLG
jgi:hypothetical protein